MEDGLTRTVKEVYKIIMSTLYSSSRVRERLQENDIVI